MSPTFTTSKRTLGTRVSILLVGAPVLAALALVQAPPAFAAPTNDMFSNATLISGATGSVAGTGVGATA